MASKDVLLEIDKYPISNVISCAKLYKMELFENIRFPINKIHEDEFTTYKLLYKSKIVSFIHTPIYYYRFNENSITNKKFSNKDLMSLMQWKKE